MKESGRRVFTGKTGDQSAVSGGVGGQGISRRSFVKAGVAGLATLYGLSAGGSRVLRAQSYRPDMTLELPVEPNAELRVLRWVGFVKSDEEWWERNTRRWEEMTGAKVEIEYESWEDVRPKAAMAANMGAGPDIVLGWYDDPHLYPHRLVDLTDVAEYLDAKYGGFYETGHTYGYDHNAGRWIALPIGAAGIVFNHRISWMKEAGFDEFPSTTEGFLELAKALHRIGHPVGFPLGHAVGDGNSWVHWCLWAHGGMAVNEAEEVVINSAETRAALEYAKELYEVMLPGVASWLDPHNNRAFLAGEVSVVNNGISIYYVAKEEFPEMAEDIGHAPMPIGPIGRPSELCLITNAFIFSHTPYPNAAKDYLRFMMEEAQYGQWITAMRGYISPSLRHYRNLPVWTEDPKHEPFRDLYGRLWPNSYAGKPSPKSAAAMSEYILVDMFADACLGRASIDDAIRTAERRLRRIYR